MIECGLLIMIGNIIIIFFRFPSCDSFLLQPQNFLNVFPWDCSGNNSILKQITFSLLLLRFHVLLSSFGSHSFGLVSSFLYYLYNFMFSSFIVILILKYLFPLPWSSLFFHFDIFFDYIDMFFYDNNIHKKYQDIYIFFIYLNCSTIFYIDF